MGLSDREYARDEPGLHLSMPQSVTMRLVVVNIAVYLLQLLTQQQTPSGPTSLIDEYFALKPDWFARPWEAYQLLTYGFLHSLRDVMHLLVNMLVLWMFGREVEQRYGSRRYLAFYLTAVVISGLGWSLVELVYEGPSAGIIGASGGISAVFVLYALNWPHRQVLFMFVIPMPIWVAAAMAILYDAYGAVHRSGNVAFTAHLAGTLYGFLFYRTGFNPLAALFEKGTNFKPRNGPKLRVHAPDEDEDGGEIDRILRKISEHGQDSLTRRERRTLENESRRIKEGR